MVMGIINGKVKCFTVDLAGIRFFQDLWSMFVRT